MMEQALKTIDELFSFISIENNKNHFICKCGNHFFNEMEEELNLSKEEMENLQDLQDIILFNSKDKIKCPECGNNFNDPEEKARLIPVDTFFIGGFRNDSDDAKLVITFWRIKKELFDGQLLSIKQEKNFSISLKTSEITYKNYKDQLYTMRLDNLLIALFDFFSNEEIKMMLDIQECDYFLNQLIKLLPDREKMDFVGEIFMPMRGKRSDVVMDYIKQIFHLSLSLLLYNNLSTVVLTKNLAFLHDLLISTDEVALKELDDKSPTAPLDIFNVLTEGYIRKISNIKIEDVSDKKEFIYTGGGDKSMKIQVRNQNFFDKIDAYRTKDQGYGDRGGRSSIVQEIKDGKISKFIFKSLRHFYDYKQLVKYTNNYSLEEIANIIKKYDLDYIVSAIDMIYWRDKMTDKEFHQLFRILTDFTIEEKKKSLIMSGKLIEEADITPDYSMVPRFDFTLYDDCLTMMEAIKDRLSSDDKDLKMFERQNYFDDIKKFKDLKKFHDNLASQYKFMEGQLSGTENSYEEYVGKYGWLEEKGTYEGPIEVHLLRTLGDFMREGQLMDSSASYYGKKIVQKIYLVARLIDHSEVKKKGEPKRFTIGFTLDRYGFLEFDQLKGHKNIRGSDATKALVIEWLKAKDISYKEIGDLRYEDDGTIEV